MARQKLGQHFLADLGWRKRILETLPRAQEDVWVEIGPGHGEMTQLLISRARRLIAIEADVRLADGLRALQAARVAEGAEEWRRLEIVSGDVLQQNLAQLTGDRFRVYGNLPYYITSPILRHLFDAADRITSIHIVVQFEVAARIVARPGRRDYGFLSVLCQFYAHPGIELRIPPGAFRPQPRVTSALVSITLPGERASLSIADEKRFLDFVGLCFSQKRKTLRNNLRSLAPTGRIAEALAACGVRPYARAEQLSLAQFAALFIALAG
jgi:16S rRNA (adenine1518-N6/adenine1519-N6)-dimethyltransferase